MLSKGRAFVQLLLFKGVFSFETTNIHFPTNPYHHAQAAQLDNEPIDFSPQLERSQHSYEEFSTLPYEYARQNPNNALLINKPPKETDRKWTFYIPDKYWKPIFGKGKQHLNRYTQQKYVNIFFEPNALDPKIIKINGQDTSFENVYDVCMDIWQRIIMVNDGIAKARLPMQLSSQIDRLNPSPFQQFLFMEDYNVFFRKVVHLWKVYAFSTEDIEVPKTALESSNPFRQDAPFSPSSSVHSLTSAVSCASLNEKKTEQNSHKKAKKKVKLVYNKKAFEKLPTKVVIENDDSISSCLKKETNILLLGQSGVGKSTFLNSFANYIEFGQDFNKAETGLRVMIKASYVFSYDETGQEIYTDPMNVLLQPEGEDDGNEVLGDGQSATQEARCYTFQYEYRGEEKVIRVIDTPGLLDTEGIEKDQRNLAQILKCVKRFPTIQAIIFLLKPDEARAATPLLFCLSELLGRIHKEAARNILFCLPRSDRTTQVEAAKALSSFFKKISDRCEVNLEMKMNTTDGCQNVFRFDNYGFLYCGAKKFAGFKEKGKERQMAMERWTNSVKDIEKMLKTIANLPDYPIQRSLEINDTKNWLKALAVPMADLSRQILDNESKLQAKQEEIKQLAQEQKTIEGHATHEENQFVRVPLDNWRVCCYGENCCISYNESDKIPDICHDNCECYEGEEETGQNIPQCQIFKNGVCSRCNCPWDVHRRMKWKLEKNTIVIKSEVANTNLTERQKAVDFINGLEQRIKANGESMKQMQKNAAIFVCFIQQNSLVAEGDSFGMYLDQCIELAKSSGDQNQYQKLNKFKENYEQEKKMFTEAGKTGEKVTFEEVCQKLEEMQQNAVISDSIKQYRQILGIDDEETDG